MHIYYIRFFFTQYFFYPFDPCVRIYPSCESLYFIRYFISRPFSCQTVKTNSMFVALKHGSHFVYNCFFATVFSVIVVYYKDFHSICLYNSI
ncbi:Uncharacterised protein [Bacteroides salyersiae]|nr:Uncharacterised protein [Bacteroides salyersiae]